MSHKFKCLQSLEYFIFCTYFDLIFNCSPFFYISVLLHIGYFQDLLILNFTIINFPRTATKKIFSYMFRFFVILDYLTTTSIFKTFWVIEKRLKSFQFFETLMSLRVGMVIFQENNPSVIWVLFLGIQGNFEILPWRMNQK